MRRPNKYHARKTRCPQGHVHDSGMEARRCTELTLMERAGEISHLEQQPRYVLVVCGLTVGTVTWDFRYWGKDRQLHIEDVKGGYRLSEAIPIRRKLMLALYGIDVKITRPRT